MVVSAGTVLVVGGTKAVVVVITSGTGVGYPVTPYFKTKFKIEFKNYKNYY